MRIEHNGNNEITITGNIKSIEDGAQIKEAVNALKGQGAKNIQLKIVDSFSMTSTVIGFLMKVINIDQIRVSMLVGDQRLHQLLEELSLVQAFNVRYLEK